ncbi:hypothetical protein LTS15_008265 [Exophiala xenobiotica]|nr:hypothetical protein LTS15_008265 [Exophiala xenobiotica]
MPPSRPQDVRHCPEHLAPRLQVEKLIVDDPVLRPFPTSVNTILPDAPASLTKSHEHLEITTSPLIRQPSSYGLAIPRSTPLLRLENPQSSFSLPLQILSDIQQTIARDSSSSTCEEARRSFQRRVSLTIFPPGTTASSIELNAQRHTEQFGSFGARANITRDTRLFGFLLGSTLAGASVYYYILEEYKVSNELLTEDIYALQAAVQRIHSYVSELENKMNQLKK